MVTLVVINTNSYCLDSKFVLTHKTFSMCSIYFDLCLLYPTYPYKWVKTCGGESYQVTLPMLEVLAWMRCYPAIPHKRVITCERRSRFPAWIGEAPGPAGTGLARSLFKKWCGSTPVAPGKRAVKKSDRRLGGWRPMLGFARTEARPCLACRLPS